MAVAARDLDELGRLVNEIESDGGVALAVDLDVRSVGQIAVRSTEFVSTSDRSMCWSTMPDWAPIIRLRKSLNPIGTR